MADQDGHAGDQFIWQQAEQRLDAQLRQADALDSKSGVLVGFHALAAGLAASQLSRLHGGSRWIAVAIIVGLAVSGTTALWAYRSQAYDRKPSPRTLARYNSWDPGDIQYRFLSTRLEAIDENARKLSRKAKANVISLLVFGVLALGAATMAVIGLARNT